ncbi:Apyrase, partial [Intoshia linei]
FHLEKDYWISYLKNATLTLNRSKPLLHPTISVNTGITKLISKLAYQHRGMELSELIVYDGRMLTIDDRSGIVYEIKNYDTVVPRYILSDGPGNMTKGFKGEWATVKDKKLYIGGMGREYIAQGQVENQNNLWIKIIGKENVVISVMWDKMYNYLRKRTGYIYPGYISHEAVVWDDINKQWCFLPRRASNNSYTEEEDLVSGTNLFICTNEANTRYKQIKIGEIEKLLGFSSFRFVPHTENKLIVAIKTHEQPEDSLLKNKSYLWLFDINGNVYADHILIGEGKYEGLEFV